MYGDAALIMFCDVSPGSEADHDDWHTHEHMPERLGIPGFLRGSRCTVEGAGPRYMMIYEVAGIEVLTGPDYAARLEALRGVLRQHGVDGFVLMRTDEHGSEYLPGYAERVAWLTGFTGSAAQAVVLMERAAVFSDGSHASV